MANSTPSPRRRSAGRPRQEVFSRRAALTAALRVIDTEGEDALTISRLGRELGVHGSSLYHHFESKDAILREVVLMAFEELRVPPALDDGWEEFLIDSARRYRQVLISHPGLLSVLVRVHSALLGPAKHEGTIALLEQHGVPLPRILPMLEALERHALGSALYARATSELERQRDAFDPQLSHLARAIDAAAYDHDETFELSCRAIVERLGAPEQPGHVA